MTKPNSWAELIADFNYRPGYCLSVIEDQDGFRTRLEVTAHVENTYRRGEMIPIQFNHILWPWERIGGVEEALLTLRDALHKMEMHESDEWMRYKGEMIFDPHASEKQLSSKG